MRKLVSTLFALLDLSLPPQSNIVVIYADDLGESSYLTTKNPKQLEGMKALLEKLIVQGRSAPGPKQKNDVKVRRYPQ